jgi:hypothetical protein
MLSRSRRLRQAGVIGACPHQRDLVFALEESVLRSCAAVRDQNGTCSRQGEQPSREQSCRAARRTASTYSLACATVAPSSVGHQSPESSLWVTITNELDACAICTSSPPTCDRSFTTFHVTTSSSDLVSCLNPPLASMSCSAPAPRMPRRTLCRETAPASQSAAAPAPRSGRVSRARAAPPASAARAHLPASGAIPRQAHSCRR